MPASARALTVTRRCGDQNRARWARDLVEPSVWLGGRRRRGPRAISCDGATQDRRAVPPAVPATQPSARKWPEATLLARPAPSSSEDQRKAGPSGAEWGRAGPPVPGAGTPLRSGGVLGQSPSQAREDCPGRPPARVPPVLLPSCQSTEETAETLPSTANQPSIQLIRQSFLNLIFITVSLF